MKKCTRCKEDKDVSLFGKCKATKDGLSIYCKKCANERKHKWKKYNIDYIKKKKDYKGVAYSKVLTDIALNITSWMDESASLFQRIYHIKNDKLNIDKCINCNHNDKKFMDYKKDYSDFCSKECRSDYTKKEKKKYKDEYYRLNKERIIEKATVWAKNNRKKINEAAQRRKKKDPIYWIWRSVLQNALVRMRKKKDNRTIKLLGYSPQTLKEHLEKLFLPGMTWDNYGKWSVDHIKAVSRFDRSTPMHIVNALSNLQPLWHIDNIKKGNK